MVGRFLHSEELNYSLVWCLRWWRNAKWLTAVTLAWQPLKIELCMSYVTFPIPFYGIL